MRITLDCLYNQTKTIMKAYRLPFIILCLLALSCAQDNGIDQQSELTVLSNRMLDSESFSSLDISANLLDAGQVQFTGPDKKSVVIPFRGNTNKGIVGLFNDRGELRTVGYFEAVTGLSSQETYKELKSGDFNGGFIFRYENVSLEITLEKSKIIRSKGTNSLKTGRSMECRSWDGYGGVLWCAGSRLENMNWFDATLCYASFPSCMAALVISCGIDGCAIQ